MVILSGVLLVFLQWGESGITGSYPASAIFAQLLAEKGLFVWTGDFYASSMIDCLELRGRGGLVRIGIAPYNTKDELQKVIDALKQI